MLLHLPVCKSHIRLRHQLGKGVCHLHNGIDPIIDIINLTSPCQFPADGLPDHLLIVFHHISLNRYPFTWRLLQHTHIPDTDQAHVKRSGDRCRRQRQHIHIFPKLFDLLLMSHAKTLLLINDQKPQILKLHILRQYPVRSDQDIHQSFFRVCECPGLLLLCTEAAEQIHPYREILHPLDKIIVMLLCQDRGRYEKNYLFSVLYGLKCCPDGNFCLSVTHISTDQPVHDLGAFHILFGCLNSSQLIIRLIIRKRFFKFSLPDGVFAVYKTVFCLADRI